MRTQMIQQAAAAASGWIPLVIFLVMAGGIGIGVGVGVHKIRTKVRQLSRAAFGTDSFIEGLNRQAEVLAETPKSVSGMTRIYEPLIMKDFPDFSWNEFRDKAENMLVSALLSISTGNIGHLTSDASDDVKRQIENRIGENAAAGIKETYNDIRIHRTEIADYRKEGGKCLIKIQSAVEYVFFREQSGKVIKGTKDRKTQTKYNVELLYIQDERLAGGGNTVAVAICPNCGAPIRSLGNMYCEYCGTGVKPVNIKVWSLHKFYEVDYNRV